MEKNDSYNNLTIKSRSWGKKGKKKKNGAGTRLIPVQRAFVSSAQAENYVWI